MKKSKVPISFSTISSLVIISLSIIAFSLYCIYKLDPGKKPGPSKSVSTFNKEIEIGGSFEMLDTNKNTFTQENLEGKISVLYFGFTYCPDICPTSLNLLSEVIDGIPQYMHDKLQVIFISVDYDRDDPATVKEYLNNFNPKIIGLTGTKKQVNKITENYKVYHNKVGNDEENFLIDHTSIIYVMGEDGKYLKHFSSNATSEQISNELIKYLK
jgi:protein SCO1/2